MEKREVSLRLCECGRIPEMKDTGYEVYWYCECGKIGPNQYYACCFGEDGEIDNGCTERLRAECPECHEQERYWAKIYALESWNAGHVFDASF